MTRTVDEAFAAVRDGEGPDSLYTTLAPVYDAVMADADRHYEDQAWLVNAETDDADRILEVGCGLGGLLAELDDRERLVGVDRHPELLRFARRRTDAPLAVGDATAVPVRGSFDACVALGYVTAHLDGDRADRAFAEAYASLAPGGRLVVDAPEEPRALLEDTWNGRRGRYRIDRTVTAGEVDRGRAEMALHYEIEDVEAGRSVETTEDVAVELYDQADLAESLEAVGFESVEVTRKLGDEGALLATATRPET